MRGLIQQIGFQLIVGALYVATLFITLLSIDEVYFPMVLDSIKKQGCCS
ncbi:MULTISPECIES: hypothetical protein [Nitrosomonas]|nr:MULTISPECIES: hypothetical protein [Nitrosomonas]UVS61358.1 hypothetical protein NX761_18105 [Nitrosomonas sp. PLL12]